MRVSHLLKMVIFTTTLHYHYPSPWRVPRSLVERRRRHTRTHNVEKDKKRETESLRVSKHQELQCSSSCCTECTPHKSSEYPHPCTGRAHYAPFVGLDTLLVLVLCSWLFLCDGVRTLTVFFFFFKKWIVFRRICSAAGRIMSLQDTYYMCPRARNALPPPVSPSFLPCFFCFLVDCRRGIWFDALLFQL